MLPVFTFHLELLLCGKLPLFANELEAILGRKHIGAVLSKLILAAESEKKHVSLVFWGIEL